MDESATGSVNFFGPASPVPETLLVNYWYAAPVGHAVEGLRYALGYKAANPELRVSLLLNGATAVELGSCCDFLDAVYAVPYTGFLEPDADPAAALAAVPRAWDWVVENHRTREPSHDAFAGFRAFFDASHSHLEPRHPLGVAGHAPPAYAPHRPLRLELPAAAREAATLAEPRAIAIVLAGSSAERELYPSIASWQLILAALSARFPGTAFPLIGKLAADGRTTSCVTREEVDRLLDAVPAAVDCFDRPLLEQAALVGASSLLVAPHTGFAFLASTVGTPWLALSGGRWHEYFFNGEPVYSLLPDRARYPGFAWGGALAVIDDEDGEGPRTPSMSIARFRDDLPELLHAAELLVDRRLSSDDALAAYVPRLVAAYAGDLGRAFTFDNVGSLYLQTSR